MIKRIISIVLALSLALSVLCFGAASVSAIEKAEITAGGTKYTAAVGDYFKYTVSFTYIGTKLTTAQIELPVDFTGLNSYTQSEIDSFMSEIAPTTSDKSVVLRSAKRTSSLGLDGYVMNFVNPNGYSFSTSKVVFSLIFSVEKAGSYDLTAKVRNVADLLSRTIVDGDYRIKTAKFSYKESIEPVKLDTPKVSVATAAGGMKVSWDPVPRASLYRVYYKGRNGWTKLTDTKETSVLDTDVVGGTRYTYTVRCLSADASRFVSDYDTAGKSAVYYPAPKLTLSNAEDAVSIKWNAVTGASKYRLYVLGGSGWSRLTDTASTSYTDSGVTSGTTRTYTIRSMDSNGNLLSSYYSDGFMITFLSAPVFSLSNAADGVNISWNKVTGAAKYRIFYKGRNGWTRMVDTAETSFIDKDVVSNTTYTYTVRCINENGSEYTSDYRAGKSLHYIAAPKLTLSNAEDGVYIKWNAVSGASKYRVYYRGRNGWTRMVDTASTSYVDYDVKSGTNYTYTIRCMDSSGNLISSFYSDGFRIAFVKAPVVSLSNAADGVEISWDKVEGAVRYRVYYRGRNGWTKLTETSETSFIDKDVVSNTNYTYTVRCINEDGTAFTSDYRAGKTIRYVAAPRLTLTSDKKGVGIKWDAVAGASKYRVYIKNGSGWTRLTETSSTSYTDTSAVKGKAYTYTIRCMDSDGNFASSFYTEGFTITYMPT